jgi:CRISPR-associated Csx2 family protein
MGGDKMARVFISVLGTNNYEMCSYFIGESYETRDFEKRDVRFVQEAAIEHFCEDWTQEDRIRIFTTDKAHSVNWVDNGHEDFTTKKKLAVEGLGKRLDRMNLIPSVRPIWIPDGRSQSEIWKIFQIIFDELKQGDRVVFDITHALRSIPLLVMVILNYAKVVRGVRPERICYGAFEVLGEIREVKEMPLELRNAPMFDLTPFDTLLDWTQAIDLFLTAGDASRATQLAEREVRQIKKELRRPDPGADFLKRVALKLQDFSLNLSTCRGSNLSADAAALKGLLEDSTIPDHLPGFTPLLERLRDELDRFSGQTLKDGLAAAQWCLDHNLIQQGFTILQEALVTHVTEKLGLDQLNHRDRDLVSQFVRLLRRIEKRDDGQMPRTEALEACLRLLGGPREFAGAFDDLTGLRNDLNHAGWRTNFMSARDFRGSLEMYIEKFTQYADLHTEGA